MNETVRAFIVIGIAAAVTALLRFLPFAVFSGKRKTPEIVTYLGRVLPAAVMAMLVVFCLRGVTFSSLSGWLPALIAAVVTAVIYLPTKKTLISIIGGTVTYMLLIQFVFI